MDYAGVLSRVRERVKAGRWAKRRWRTQNGKSCLGGLVVACAFEGLETLDEAELHSAVFFGFWYTLEGREFLRLLGFSNILELAEWNDADETTEETVLERIEEWAQG